MCLALALAGLNPGCRRDTAPTPPTPEVSTRTVVDEHGKTVRVTTFTAPQATATGLTALRTRCDGGDQEGCADLAHALLSAADYPGAESVWKRACDAGHGRSCAELGYQYNNPFITLPHPEWAMDVLTRGCESAVHPPIACASLAKHYADGRYGIPADAARHRELIARACRDGHYWSCQQAGMPVP